MNIIRKIIVAGVILTVLGMLNACGTVHGFGKDVSRAGHDIQKASR